MNSPSITRRRSLIALVIILALIATGAVLWFRSHKNADHADDHGAHGNLILTLNDGKPWETDEALRLGMQRIRDAVALQWNAGSAGTLSPAEAHALAETVRQNVTFLIQNCRLVPAADATLHAIINELMASAALLSSEGHSREGIEQLAHALDQYHHYFDHPNWEPLPELAS